jgi:enoyl-CoA hydratase
MIDLRTEDGIAIMTMAHGKANALDVEFCNALAERFDALRNDPAKAVILTAEGKIFSAGVDLKRLVDNGPAYVREFLPSLHRLYEAVFFHPKPVVAAINGHAIAGGCVLAACADRRIIAQGMSRVGVTELLVGVAFPPLAFEVVRSVVPERFLPEVLYSGATYDTDTAVERGWIDEVVEAEDLMEDALAVAQELAELPPAAFAMTKAQIREPARDRLAKSGAAAEQAATEIWCADETLRRIGDYVARTLRK